MSRTAESRKEVKSMKNATPPWQVGKVLSKSQAKKAIKDAIYSSAMSKAGGLLIKGQMQKLKDKFNYETYGSAPILGVNGLVFKMHGSSSANAVYHAVHSAARVASGNVVEEIRNSIKDYQKQ